MTQAGKLRERIVLSRRLETDDGFGNVSGQWQDFVTVSARILPLKGGEEVMASRLDGRQPVVITVRRSSDTLLATTGWRAWDQRSGTIYNIQTVTPTEDKTVIDMIAVAGVVT